MNGNISDCHEASAIAVIPVRGGSVGIPRKNARLLNGKPLLSYAIESCLAAKTIAATYVSTEDEELVELARRFGAQVLPRSKDLASAEATLDQVIVDAAQQLQAQNVSEPYVVTLQATCPLISTSTIDHAVQQCHEQSLDTVLTVVDDRHLAWEKNKANQTVPLYKHRVNRQSLPCQFRETGGVVVCKQSVLDTGTRFGTKVGVLEISKTESLDIDDYFDWWLVERSLKRRSICFHVIGNRDTGMGHVSRALTLADRLIHHDVWFLIAKGHELALGAVQDRFYPICVVEPGKEIDALANKRPDLLINDALDTDQAWMQTITDLGFRVVNFEDLGTGSPHADLVINDMYEAAEPTLPHVLSGASYSVLRDEFYSAKCIDVRSDVQNILMLFGGVDSNDMTSKCLKWLDTMDGNWRITVVLGRGYEHPDNIQSMAKTMHHKVEVVVNTSMISNYMQKADLAITSAGRTVFELASLGIPMLVIPQNDREMLHKFADLSLGVVLLPRARVIDQAMFTDAVSQMTKSRLLRDCLHRSLLGTDLKAGVGRVVEQIEQLLEEATQKKRGAL